MSIAATRKRFFGLLFSFSSYKSHLHAIIFLSVKHRNNPALRYFFLYLRKIGVVIALGMIIPIALVSDRFSSRSRLMAQIFTMCSYLIAYINLEDFEKWLKENVPQKDTYSDNYYNKELN